jgi:hypothetical protein
MARACGTVLLCSLRIDGVWVVAAHHTGLCFAGTDISPIVPALEKIWRDSKGQSLADFNFRTGMYRNAEA